ncbi:hypothetical protein KC344_g182 [Hortaea werneckii]|nr:hypothetical protein KC344_g182 [Hortaea werneckii]
MDSEGVVFCTSSVSRRDLVTRRFDWRRPSAAGIQSLSGICQSRQLIGLVRPSPHGTIQLLIHRDLEKIIDNSPHHDHGRHVPVDGAIMAIHYEPFPPVYGHIPSGTGICADVIFFTVCAEIGVLLFSGCKNRLPDPLFQQCSHGSVCDKLNSVRYAREHQITVLPRRSQFVMERKMPHSRTMTERISQANVVGGVVIGQHEILSYQVRELTIPIDGGISGFVALDELGHGGGGEGLGRAACEEEPIASGALKSSVKGCKIIKATLGSRESQSNQ